MSCGKEKVQMPPYQTLSLIRPTTMAHEILKFDDYKAAGGKGTYDKGVLTRL